MTTGRPLDPRVEAFRRVATAVIRGMEDLALAWWSPGDGQEADARLEDGWCVALIGGRELFRMPIVELEAIAEHIRLDRN